VEPGLDQPDADVVRIPPPNGSALVGVGPR
jgi:hypothetical protein